MRKYLNATLILIAAALVFHSQCLHLKVLEDIHSQTSTSQEQLNYLINLQNKYASGVKMLTSNAQSIRKRIQQSSTIQEQITILENAVKNERANIGSLASTLALDPESGLIQCSVLPPEKQTKLNDDASMIEWRVNQLESLVRMIPDCDQITAIKEQIEKMKKNLESVQKISSSPCEKNLIKTPAVFQSNLYQNSNWLLGSMTMNQLIDQYYKRSLSFGNITNCPIDRPFLATSNVVTSPDSCIQCPSKTPYFDLSKKICTNCDAGLVMDVTTRKCIYPPKNSNYDAGVNYQLQPLKELPLHQPSLTYCPPQTPFFNGTICVACPPETNYWKVSESKCNTCPNYTVFKIATRKCQKNPPIYVYGSYDRLLATKQKSIADYNSTLADAIAKNPSKPPTQCPDPTQYAAITNCVTCNPNKGSYFNVETLSCSFCDGVPDAVTNLCSQRKYYFVNPNASNILLPANQSLSDIAASNEKTVQENPVKYSICPESDPFPYNNKTSCGQCSSSAPLYSLQLSGCTFCPAPLLYDPRQRQCRPLTYLTNYDKNVIITPPTTLESLISAEAELNKTKLTKKCPLSTPYSPDGRVCMDCTDIAPYFDIKSELCISCTYPQTYSAIKKGCYKINYLTNLSAPDLLEVQNYTVANVKTEQDSIRLDNSKVYQDCPPEKPYGLPDMCVKCLETGALFNLKTKSCQFCPPHTVYNSTTRKCITILNITNLNAGAKNIIQNDQYTIADYTNEIQSIKKVNPTSLCPATTPFVVNGICQACEDYTPYFILATRGCGFCDNFMSKNNTCPPKIMRYSNLSNYYWVTNDGNADKVINRNYQLKNMATGPKCPFYYNERTKNCVSCPASYMYNFDTGQCIRCDGETVFDLNIHKCSTAQAVGSYYTNLQSSPNDLQLYGGLTLDELKSIQLQEKKKYSGSQYCPSSTPFYDNIQCIKCPNYKKYFNLRYKICQICLQNEKLQANDCINVEGNKVWQEPIAEKVYPYLFGQL